MGADASKKHSKTPTARKASPKPIRYSIVKRTLKWQDPWRNSDGPPNSSRSRLRTAEREQILAWIAENLHKLIHVVKKKAFLGDIRVRKPRSQLELFREYTDIGRRVCQHPQVTQFPCFFNVLQTVFRCLRKELERLCDNHRSNNIQRLHLVAGRARFIIIPQPSFEKEKKVCGRRPGCRTLHDVNATKKPHESVTDPRIYAELSRLRADLPDPTTYWTIIREASMFDLHPERIGKFIVRTALNQRQKGLLTREWVLSFTRIIAPIREELQGIGEAAGRTRDFIGEMQSKFRLSPDNVNPHFMALISVSHQLAKKITIEDCYEAGDGARACDIVVNDRCHSFWNSRYLFAGETTNGGSRMNGVAIDTLTGKVENANMKYVHTLCPREGWECTLSDVTIDRWNRYVARNRYSLSKFYFEPQSLLIKKEWSPKGDSILFSPL